SAIGDMGLDDDGLPRPRYTPEAALDITLLITGDDNDRYRARQRATPFIAALTAVRAHAGVTRWTARNLPSQPEVRTRKTPRSSDPRIGCRDSRKGLPPGAGPASNAIR